MPPNAAGVSDRVHAPRWWVRDRVRSGHQAPPVAPPIPTAPPVPTPPSRVPVTALVGLGPTIAGTRLRVLLVAGQAREVKAGVPVPGGAGLPIFLPEGGAVELLVARDQL